MNSSSDTSVASTKPKRALSIFSLLISLIAIILVILAAIFILPNLSGLEKTKHNTNAQITSINNSLKETQSTLTNLTEQLTKQQAAQKKLAQDNHASQHPEAIYINQAISLLQLAEIQLSMQANPSNAIVYLKNATELLTKTGHTQFATSIKQLQSLTDQLDNSQTLDINQSIQAINSLKDAMTQLSLTPSLPSSTPTAAKASSPKGFYNKLKHQLSQLVIVRHHKTAQAPLTTANDETSFKQNLLLKASEAEWSLLNNNAELYENSLSTIIQQLDSTPMNDKQKNAILNQVNQLKMQSLDLDKDSAISQINSIMNDLLVTLTPKPSNTPTTPSQQTESKQTATPTQPQTKPNTSQKKPHSPTSSNTPSNPISIEI